MLIPHDDDQQRDTQRALHGIDAPPAEPVLNRRSALRPSDPKSQRTCLRNIICPAILSFREPASPSRIQRVTSMGARRLESPLQAKRLAAFRNRADATMAWCWCR